MGFLGRAQDSPHAGLTHATGNHLVMPDHSIDSAWCARLLLLHAQGAGPAEHWWPLTQLVHVACRLTLHMQLLCRFRPTLAAVTATSAGGK